MACENSTQLDGQPCGDALLSQRFQTKFPVHFALGILTWTCLWFLRSKWDSSRWQGVWILVGVLGWKHGADLSSAIDSRFPLSGKTAYSIFGFVVGFVTMLCFKAYVEPSWRISTDPPHGQAPWLLPSRTSHTRLFPKVHSFSYSYLQIAVPVGSEGRFGALISIGNVKSKGWFHVQASDYLDRNSSDDNLKSKLSTYLRSQGIEDSQWDHAYLFTAPRFLGYAFNPVSFWYIYNAEDVLTMMVLEVNNTFDERRMYFLEAKKPDEKSDDSHSDSTTTVEELNDLPPKFRNAWTKDFHVSPFNSRKGYYMLTAIDPFQGPKSSDPVFNNSIVLKSSKDYVKLIARVFSQGQAINPLTSGRWEILRFMLSWFWVGFMTFPRILKEAAKLFFKRGLDVWFRPEVMPTTIGRQEENIETEIAPFFEAYLQPLIAHYNKPIRVLYKSNLKESIPRTFSNIPGVSKNAKLDTIDLEIRVLSPAFFARFIHYSHTTEAFDRECVFTDEKNRTIWLSRPDLFSELMKSATQGRPNFIPEMGWWERFRWAVHKRLRCPPSTPAYHFSTNSVRMEDIRQSTFSPLDRFVMEYCPGDAVKYRRLCARLFLAERFAFGFVGVVDAVYLLARFGVIWGAVESGGRLLAGLLHF